MEVAGENVSFRCNNKERLRMLSALSQLNG